MRLSRRAPPQRHTQDGLTCSRAVHHLPGRNTIVIVCNLPTLRNPSTNMVHDALKAPPYNFRDTQIAELLEQVQNPEDPMDLVLILDGE